MIDHNSSTPRLASLTRDLDSLDDRCRANAFNDILEMANDGNGDAMFQVARCLQKGIGVEANHVSADRWLRMACVATPASRVALYTHGMQHVLKQREDADTHKGISFIERAASQGYVTAILALVEIVENGVYDIKPDLHRAFRLLAGTLEHDSDGQLHEAYLSFVERHGPITHLLDS
ncbi:tetratricopeptide repeat protein [Pseudomonas sp. NCHU5208]|uniref:tetratricopeptide repeat protein n=1 Tax=unclassified Pseudomonas TaxID=196821 RepID=UPI003F9B653B